ncbi:hypothetical protein LX32DRAFT_40727 [Colletotrichum zoysiae]|uniref:Uncharacterized protein n=1 Tax=Colletotrichum zoysiae TaxID=1216348 RepID=A0AAD9HBD5_9PEZI|nr:hypothetical protein LX32DRAFT_40727 [Colletotrichum zoysiae]
MHNDPVITMLPCVGTGEPFVKVRCRAALHCTALLFIRRLAEWLRPVCQRTQDQTNRPGLGFLAMGTEHRSSSMPCHPTNQTNKGRHGRRTVCAGASELTSYSAPYLPVLLLPTQYTATPGGFLICSVIEHWLIPASRSPVPIVWLGCAEFTSGCFPGQ